MCFDGHFFTCKIFVKRVSSFLAKMNSDTYCSMLDSESVRQENMGVGRFADYLVLAMSLG